MNAHCSLPVEVDTRCADWEVKHTFLQLKIEAESSQTVGRRSSCPLYAGSSCSRSDIATSCGEDSDSAGFGVDSDSEDASDAELDALPVTRYNSLDFEDTPQPVMVSVPAGRMLPVNVCPLSPVLIPSVESTVQYRTYSVVNESHWVFPAESVSFPVAPCMPPTVEEEAFRSTSAWTALVVGGDSNDCGRRAPSTSSRKMPRFQKDPWSDPTSIIFRNLPLNYTRDMFVSMLDAHGFYGKYDFIYLPIDGSTDASLGFGFVNMHTHEEACRALQYFAGFSQWSVPSAKVCHVEWSKVYQGLSRQIGRFRNSSLMHPSVPDHRKPILLRKGARSQFPQPTVQVDPPKSLKGTAAVGCM